jgi:flagellar protein FlaI
MADLILPFQAQEREDSHEDLFSCGLYRLLPEEMQEACQRNEHLLEYLHMIPIEELGVPEYHKEMNRKLGDLKHRNLIYPVSDDIHIHVLSGEEERDFYIPIEPTMGLDITRRLEDVEERLVDLAYLFEEAEDRAEKEAAMLKALDMVCEVVAFTEPEEKPVPKSAAARVAARAEAAAAAEAEAAEAADAKAEGRKPEKKQEKKQETKGGKRGLFGLFGGGGKEAKKTKVKVTEREYNAIRYVLIRDKVGAGTLESFIYDNWIEDISCSGLGPIFLEHKVFKSLRSTLEFTNHEDLDEFVLRLSESIKRPVTLRNPIVDATLEDGSRINIVYGQEVSQRGSNFTIRKAPGIPLSIIELASFGSISYQMAAYMSLILEAGMNAFICGETASGKTTLINAMTTFVPPDAKIVSIEDTPEVMVPHPNWIREVSRAGGVSMLDLLKAALRQRPNLIIIGEIRGEEGAIAFQAMQTGHAVMATFHAATVEKLIQRLTGNPINVPKTYIENLNVAVMQSLVKLPNGKAGRRAIAISEIVGYDPPSDSFSFVEVFRWNPATDNFDFVGDKNSFLLEERIAPMKGFAPEKKWGIYSILERRAKVLAKLQSKGISGYYDLLKVLNRAQQEGVF